MEDNLEGKKVEIIETGEVGEVTEHFPEIGELTVDLNTGWFETHEDEVKLLENIECKCPKCGEKFPKSELEEV